MTARHRAQSASRSLGLDAGPRVTCRRCDGSGLVEHESATEARLVRRLADSVEKYGLGPATPARAPVEGSWPPVCCSLCRGTGAAAEQTVAAWEQEVADGAARWREKLMEVGRRLALPPPPGYQREVPS